MQRGHSCDSSASASPLFLARASPAARHVTDSTPYLTVMPSHAAAQGFHREASDNHTRAHAHTNTDTNVRRDPIAGAADNFARLAARGRLSGNGQATVAQPKASRETPFSIEPLPLRRPHQADPYALLDSHDQTTATYEALRHGSTGAYQPSVAAFSPYHQGPHYYPYPAAAMSLSYETRTFPDYPQSTMMHDPHQEQDDSSIQHHRYPSPPPPLSENPYNPQALDAATALALEEMPELPPKEESDAPSPGRSKPIPKPDREVTKGEDGRFVCSWTGCTEEVRSFNRKCEWSKVSTCTLATGQSPYELTLLPAHGQA